MCHVLAHLLCICWCIVYIGMLKYVYVHPCFLVLTFFSSTFNIHFDFIVLMSLGSG